MKACIIGAGVTGLSLLLLLTHSGIDPADIAIIDPQFNCGDLGFRWSQVQSNTPWSKTVDTLNAILGLEIPTSNNTTKLSDIADLFLSLTARIPVHRIQGFVTSVERDADWIITYHTDSTKTISCRTLFVCQGSEQKTLSHPIPSIPLEYALDSRLARYISPGDRVTVFGTMHSGTLVIKNLHDLSASITAVYRSEKPFIWDRDGAYDGIKEEAALIADKIVSGEIPVRLLRASDMSGIDANWVIYAMGFKPRSIPGIPTAYDRTGALGPNAWGFGISYPNAAPDGVHWDVSVAAFLNHMKAQLPTILQTLS
jgi:cation diffusion facilitator CzcD-associated flavoprotein CzcO